MLRHHKWLDGSEPRLKTMWLWHSAEESEHKSTAFDLYAALGGNHGWRIKWFRRATFIFIGDTLRQTWKPWRAYLRHDFHPSQQENGLSQRWLREKAQSYSPVGG